MKTIVLLLSVVAAAYAIPADTYNAAYDNFKIKELVENDRLLKNFGKCFLDQGPCTPEAGDIKKIIPEALRTDCKKCTPKQRDNIRVGVRALKKKFPELWEQLTKKVDSKGEFKESFDRFLNSSN